MGNESQHQQRKDNMKTETIIKKVGANTLEEAILETLSLPIYYRRILSDAEFKAMASQYPCIIKKINKIAAEWAPRIIKEADAQGKIDVNTLEKEIIETLTYPPSYRGIISDVKHDAEYLLYNPDADKMIALCEPKIEQLEKGGLDYGDLFSFLDDTGPYQSLSDAVHESIVAGWCDQYVKECKEEWAKINLINKGQRP